MEPVSPAAAASNGNIIELRNALAQRFPHVRLSIAERRRPASFATGIPALDELLGGGLPRGQCTELVASGHGSGSAEVVHQLLHRIAWQRHFLALVDGMGSFDAGAVEPEVLRRLLWIRCRQAADALKAMDLLLRDRNIPFVVLDLRLNPGRELRQISLSTWYRYGRLLEQNETTVLAVTPQPLVSIAYSRVSVKSAFGLEARERSRAELLPCLRFALLMPVRHWAREPMAGTG